MNVLNFPNNVVYSALALCATFLFSSCIKNTDEELHAVEEEIERASMTVDDLHTFVTDSGKYRYEFSTPELQQFDNVEEPYTDFPGGLTFRTYAADGVTLSSRITCKNAKYFKQKNLWELNNDVEGLSQKGDLINTEQMFWNTADHKIYSEKFVKITTKGQMITGVGFESDDQLSRYIIKHPGGEIDVEQ